MSAAPLPQLGSDRRIVMTLDAGGTTLKFTAIRGTDLVVEPFSLPTHPDDLGRCLASIGEGFARLEQELPERPVAISFAFPGPADYPAGIIGDLPNLPAFRGGVALGPMLEDRFGLPVFINNDGNLFVYGEALAGLLPWVNELLATAGSARRYHNLFGVTLGTGFGGGIVIDGELLVGDNSVAGEAWLLRNRLDGARCADDGASIRSVRRTYAQLTGTAEAVAPDPRRICDIGLGREPGDRAAALETFRRLGVVAGDAIAQALTLVDGLAVIGGGMAGAHPLFLGPLLDAVNDSFDRDGQPLRRLIPRAFNLEDAGEREVFLAGASQTVMVPGSARSIRFDPLQRTGIGMTRLGTTRAVAVGAYAFALRTLSGQ